MRPVSLSRLSLGSLSLSLIVVVCCSGRTELIISWKQLLLLDSGELVKPTGVMYEEDMERACIQEASLLLREMHERGMPLSARFLRLIGASARAIKKAETLALLEVQQARARRLGKVAKELSK